MQLNQRGSPAVYRLADLDPLLCLIHAELSRRPDGLERRREGEDVAHRRRPLRRRLLAADDVARGAGAAELGGGGSDQCN